MRITQQDWNLTVIRQKLWQLGTDSKFISRVNQTLHLWMVCLFQPLQNSLKGKNFDSLKDCKNLGQFSAQKIKCFGKKEL